MNILELCINNSLGGLELYFTRCARHFNDSVHNCIAVTIKDSKLDHILTDSGLKVFHLKRKSNYYPLLASKKLAKIIDANQSDIVHVHYKYDIALAVFARKFTKKKFKIVHTRQMELPHKKRNPYHKFIYKNIDLFIAITDELKKDAIKNLPYLEHRIKRLYYGVDKVDPNESRIDEFLQKFPSNKFKIAMFSRIDSQKGHHRLLNAMTILNKKGVKVQAYLFGHSMKDGHQEKLLKFIGENGLDKQVYWCGFQTNSSELLTAFDLILLPSNKETFGLVVAEAMQNGVSVMGSNTGGVPEVITDGKTGYLFTPEDYEELADKIQLMIDDPDKKEEMVKAAKIDALERFNTKDHFDSIEKLFKQTITK
jgi:glycosyltransferase involved in cell wall biosynthesis